MTDKKKIIKAAAVSAGVCAGLYLGTGALLCEGVLGRITLNMIKEDLMSVPRFHEHYLKNEIYRAADDWFTSASPKDTVLIDPSGDKIHANIIPAMEPSHKWAVLVHGYCSRPRDMARQGHHYAQQGYNTLFPFMRGHRSDRHLHSSFGYYERFDVIEWIRYIVSCDPDAEILIHGCSMGAGTTMLVTGEELPDNVKCAVADCGYTSAYDEFEVQIGEMLHLPKFPFLNAANTASRLFLGWDFRDCSPKNAVANSVTPTLFIHGEADTFVPYRMMDELYDVCSAEKDKLSVPGAAHDLSCDQQPEMYWEKTDAFIKKYM